MKPSLFYNLTDSMLAGEPMPAWASRPRSYEELQLRLAIVRHSGVQRGEGRYAEYLNSRAWIQRRLVVLVLARSKCAECGAARATEVHHKTYERVGCERLSDLSPVCGPCHRGEHPEKQGRPLEVEIRRLLPKVRRDVAMAREETTQNLASGRGEEGK